MIEPALASFPPTRRAVVELLKVKGEASAAELAGGLELTVEAVRQQLAELEEAGFVAHRRRADGPGRPTHCYSLTPAAGALFPQRYGDLTNELLDYLTPDVIPGLFERRRQRRTEAAQARMRGKSFEERVVELARILEDDGYLAVAERVDDDLWRIVERNCAILDVALKYGNACSSEIEFLRDVMPDADIERVTHIVAGAKACGYEVRRRKSSRRPARARASQRSA
jgi:DeoR family suf operon transcriptional repressor